MNMTEPPGDLPQHSRRRSNGHGAGPVGDCELRTLLADVEELLSSLSDVSEPRVLQARSKVIGTLAEVRRALGDNAGSLGRRARVAADSADQYVHGRPWTAVGLAAAIGVIMGLGAGAAARR